MKETESKWQRIKEAKRAGVLVPLFSVYSRQSIGIADFRDLKLVVDWSERSGNSIVQLLPLNEVGSYFCPYDSLSSFALEPAYICLENIPHLNKDAIKFKINKIKEAYPLGGHVDYRIKKEKMNLLWQIYAQEEEFIHPDFRNFKEKNAYWLEDFALFKVIKEYFKGRAWYEWEDGYKRRDKTLLDIFKKQYSKEIDFQVWVQWHLYQQLKEVKQYAAKKEILLKGDLPILVSRDSADVWANPDFFKLEFSAGAPPDMYCAKGQRWGMPSYNWEKIAQDNYSYLKEKLRYAQEFYHILRIDHVIGLFRIWSIPYNETPENKGLGGFFDPADEKIWGEHGRKILSVMLESTDMLLCAEDLGIIPKACPQTLKELGIPGNDVQRWVKDWAVKHDFLDPDKYRALTVAMLSTHDTTNWAAWWEHEAGTVDEALFISKCRDRGIDYVHIKDQLFDLNFPCRTRLRWLNSVNSVDKLVGILGKRKEEVRDFIDMYENTYQEKEKLWKHLGLAGKMRESATSEIVKAALKITLDSQAIFCIQLIIDWLMLSDIFKGDPYEYRINIPGTISPYNWSLTIPIPLEDLLKHKVTEDIRALISTSGRI